MTKKPGQDTGVGQDNATDVASGASDGDVTQDAQPSSGADQAQAGSTEALKQQLAKREEALQELRAVQSGQDKRIAELQGTVGNLQDERDQLDSEVDRLQNVLSSDDDASADYEEQLSELRNTAAVRESELTDQLESTTGELESLRAENERLKILVGEFPNLAALVEADALPQAEDTDDYRQKLSSLNDRFVSKEDADAYQRTKDSRPPSSPGKGQPQGLDELWTAYKNAPEGSQEQAEAKRAWYEATKRLEE